MMFFGACNPLLFSGNLHSEWGKHVLQGIPRETLVEIRRLRNTAAYYRKLGEEAKAQAAEQQAQALEDNALKDAPSTPSSN